MKRRVKDIHNLIIGERFHCVVEDPVGPVGGLALAVVGGHQQAVHPRSGSLDPLHQGRSLGAKRLVVKQ